jgi:cold shock CspA family protein
MADAEAAPRFRGVVQFFNPFRRYGFARRADGQEFYIGANALMAAGLEKVKAGDILEFSVVDAGNRSPRAIEILLIAHGDAVRGV